jgi:hypothetical protein
MEDFERTDLSSVKGQIEEGVGFVVGGHNYGRVDRMTDEELDTVARSVARIAEQAARLLDAIGLVDECRYGQESAKRVGRYAIE